ncbi:upstream-binding factor 1-like protein 1 [Bos taurus]|uniref:upstream-binding factor 1-like protein 1 n=1 Tax=Bos taurus TaxID=9913 RepID=UPI000D535955|nr:upstream-binding factor 1-like protein 1 [Bos taurus]
MAMPKRQDDWSKEDIVQLLESMGKSIPSSDGHTFKTTQSVMDWEKVAFKDFSGEMCKLKWLEVSHKKSLTAYRHISQVMRPQYIPKHPKISNQDLTRVLSEEHRKVPEQLRVKQSQDLEKVKKDIREKIALFRAQHPDLVPNPEKSGVPQRSEMKVPEKLQENVQTVKSPPEKSLPMKWKFHGEPKKPPMNGYHKFHQDLWSSRELKVVPRREHMVEISRCWQQVPQDQKELYKKQAEGLQTQYKVDLDLWLRTLPPEEYAAYREVTCVKRKNMSVTGGLNPKIRRMASFDPVALSFQAMSEFLQVSAPQPSSCSRLCPRTPLAHLAVTNWQLTESDLPHLFQSPNMCQLKGLDLSVVTMTDFSPEILHFWNKLQPPSRNELRVVWDHRIQM